MRFRALGMLGLSAGIFALLLAGQPAPATAQNAGVIEGTILESGTERPLAGVQVSVVGTNRGALTNTSGAFRISDVPAGEQEVRAQRIGYSTVTQSVSVAAGETAALSMTMRQSAVALSEVVVTGTAGGAERRALGNAVTSINAAELNDRVTNVTVSELLRGQSPGVSIMGGAGTAGAGTNIRIRGANTLLGGNQPVFYVDGVRMDTDRMGHFLASCCNPGNQQNANLLDMINPEDIESIEVIKGPAAATLYGADAAGGVIQIFTKRGQAGQQDLQWNARITGGQTEWAGETITNYAVCTQARIDNPTGFPGCQGRSVGDIISGDPLNDHPDAMRAGALRQYALSVRGGGDGYSFYVSGDIDDNEGIFHNNFSDRRSARANFTFFPTDALDFAVNLGYTHQEVRMPFSDEAAQGIMFNASLSVPGQQYAAPGGLGWWLMTPDRANQFDNQTQADRWILGTTVNYRPFEWFRNRLTVGFDNNRRHAEIFYQPNDPMGLRPEGYIAQRVPETQLYTVDYAGTMTHDLTDALSSAFSFGMQFDARRNTTIEAHGEGLGTDATRTVSAAAVTSGGQSFAESRSLGFFIQEQLGWQDRLFLTAGLRMDNNSVFGADIQRIFYPKVMGSWVVSEEPFYQNLAAAGLESLRLRAAWGQAGNAPGTYAAQRTYTVSTVTLPDGSSIPALRSGAFGNPGLQPERGTEVEAGFDLSFLQDRFGVEFTYYNQRLRDGLLSVSVPPSSGFSGSIIENLLETRNTGVELSLTALALETPAVSWEAGLNLTTNRNELLAFGDDRAPMTMGLYFAGIQQHRVGYPLGGFWGREIYRGAEAQNAQGRAINTPDGQLAAVVADTASFIGPSTPTREASLANTVTLFGGAVQLYGLLDYAGGHYQFNVRDWRRSALGLSWETVDPNTDPAELAILRQPFGQAAVGGLPEPWVQQADFLKLRDLSVSFFVPGQWTDRIGADQLRLTLAGHNVATLWTRYGGLDPEVNFHGDADFLRMDGFTVPSTRRLTASLNVMF